MAHHAGKCPKKADRKKGDTWNDNADVLVTWDEQMERLLSSGEAQQGRAKRQKTARSAPSAPPR